ncbi:hypothetical protein GAB14E_2326 [Colwellia psychrerythraea]|uniref:Uncharacterized protein n=1 Tax=Colwellia psychrerythraea TaxID=28229 RepID=A0A099KTB2_COLPS|nr:hypothetical protein GAB14E_2326 [Colwellia psychrerythraea]
MATLQQSDCCNVKGEFINVFIDNLQVNLSP